MASLVSILSNVFAPQQSTPAISAPAISTTTSSNPFSNNPFVSYNGNRFSSATYAKNQPVKFQHAGDKHRQQQCAETPLRPDYGPQHHHCEDCAAQCTHHEVLHFFTHQIYQRVRFVGYLSSDFSAFAAPEAAVFVPDALPASPSCVVPVPAGGASAGAADVPDAASSSATTTPFFGSSFSRGTCAAGPSMRSISSA